MKQSEVSGELSRLLALEIDALHAYDAAIAWVGGPGSAIGGELALFKVEHQRHALALHEALLAMGARPPEVEPDVKGVVIGALTPPRRRLNAQEVLEAMRNNEQLTTAVHRKVLALPLPEDVRALVERAHADEERHLAWIEEALARALWFQTSVVAALP
ncbi:ferritin-like domain-containing protein [Anaeromyxobacter terrae]|uniref:ferritin-like domain-containing protein n=1 Tax=Anaeromyxobacter terrae TaxID=2925406 RepID=UPI001F5826CA|nr:ferritin-like domain-containing protein [Anaeromyxobacter sp. SG22]